MWEQFLTDHDIVRIETLGQIFDPQIHEAVDKTHDPDTPDQQITKELQVGYLSKGAIIRPAKVIVNNK